MVRSAAVARLLYRDSNGREGAVELSSHETVFVGRGLECAIRSDDGMVSRRHSQVRMENGHYVIEDLGSSNGVFLNNARVQRSVLGHADVVQCGSLMIRFVDEAPVAPPPKLGGTMRLDPEDVPSAGPWAANGQGAAAGAAGAGKALPFGGPPAMPGTLGSAGPALPYGGPPSMPNGAPGTAAVRVPAPPPPADLDDAGDGPVGGADSIDHTGEFDDGDDATRARMRDAETVLPPEPRDADSEDEHTSDRGGGGGGAVAARARAATKAPAKAPAQAPAKAPARAPSPAAVDARGAVDELREQLDDLTERYEHEVADGKRVRAELATMRDREAELRRQLDDRADQVRVHEQVASDLRDEVDQARADLARVHAERGELADSATARERDAARAQDEAARLRADAEQHHRQLAELARNKDDSWKQLNDQLAEVERLRQVIDEQEKLLEERRLGMVAQDKVIQRLRAARASVAPTPAPTTSGTATAVTPAPAAMLSPKAIREAHDAINDALSALRDHAVVVQYEAPALAGDAARLRAVREAAEAIASAMDAAKRALRPLRDLGDKS